MTRFVSVLVLLLIASMFCDARIRWVDKNGGLDPLGFQKYTTIQAAIDASGDGDTVRIAPGLYTEEIIIGAAEVVVQGGGIFNTTISSYSNSATVRMTKGKLMWVAITSASNTGLEIKGATAFNCLFINCKLNGAHCNGSRALLMNCLSISNGFIGFSSEDNALSDLTCINCISYRNSYGFSTGWSGKLTAKYCISYGNAIGHYPGNWTNIGSQTIDPSFSPDGTYRTSQKNNGDPQSFDLDGKTSTIGYYGGLNAPLLPYVELPASIKLNTDGTIQFDMTGKVGY
jgi:hypothetical protein